MEQWIEAFSLQRPQWLPLLALGPLVWLLAAWTHRKRLARQGTLCDREHAARLFPRAAGRASAVCAGLGAVLMALALLGPAHGHVERRVETRGVDLVVCLDASRSMLVRDERPDRLSRARREVLGLLDLLAGDRVALVAFAGEAQRLAPLTSDRRAMAALLETVDPMDFGVGGTDLGRALEVALSLFDGRTGNHEAIVLVTDGEDLEGRGAQVAEAAKARGIRVFVVGVGTRDGGKIPSRDGRGNEVFVRDGEGREVISRLEPKTLRALAEASGAEFLSTEQSATPLEDLFRRHIQTMEGQVLEGGLERLPRDRYQLPLAAGLLLLLFAGGVWPRRGSAVRPRGLAAPSLLLAVSAVALAPGTRAVAQAPAADGAAPRAEARTPSDPPAAPRPFARVDDRIAAERFQAVVDRAALLPTEGAEWMELRREVWAVLGADGSEELGPETRARLAQLGGALAQEAWRRELRAAAAASATLGTGSTGADGELAQRLERAQVAAQSAEWDLVQAALAAGPGSLRGALAQERAAVLWEQAEWERAGVLGWVDDYLRSVAAGARPQAGAEPNHGPPPRAELVERLHALIAAYRVSREALRPALSDGPLPQRGAALLDGTSRRIEELRFLLENLPEEPPPPEQEPSEGDSSEGSEGSEDPTDGSEPSEGGAGEDQEDSEDQRESNPESEAADGTDSAPESEPQDAQGERSDDAGEEQEPQTDDPSEAEPSEGQRSGEGPTAGGGERLSAPEIQRILDRLAEAERQQQALRERLQRIRQVPVSRDW